MSKFKILPLINLLKRTYQDDLITHVTPSSRSSSHKSSATYLLLYTFNSPLIKAAQYALYLCQLIWPQPIVFSIYFVVAMVINQYISSRLRLYYLIQPCNQLEFWRDWAGVPPSNNTYTIIN